MAASLGFEPRQGDPESPVLPLHHEARSEKLSSIYRAASQGAVHGSQSRGYRTNGSREPLRSRAILSGCGFCAEQDLSAFASAFDLQRLSALRHQRASVFHHFIDHLIVMIRIVMEKQELAYVCIKRQ
jgi:hypothetical protein